MKKLKRKIENADAVVIGAGAGLSASAGFTYSGKRFEENFADFYPYDTLEEYWAYWSRYILINRYCNAPKSVYNDLYSLLRDKNYFVLTTNVDHCFPKEDFDKHRLFYTQGDYGLCQLRGSLCTNGNQRPLHLYQCRHWRSIDGNRCFQINKNFTVLKPVPCIYCFVLV